MGERAQRGENPPARSTPVPGEWTNTLLPHRFEVSGRVGDELRERRSRANTGVLRLGVWPSRVNPPLKLRKRHPGVRIQRPRIETEHGERRDRFAAIPPLPGQ